MRILLAIILAFTLGLSTVSAGEVFEYRGTTVEVMDWETRDDVEARLDLLAELGLGGPPAPPEWAVDEVKEPIVFKGDGTGGDSVKPQFDWESQDYWLYT